MKLGCHCVLYGPKIAEDTDNVLNKLVLAGAQGCEIGERFFAAEHADQLKERLSAHQLELAGMHCNGLYLLDLIYHPKKAEAAVLGVAKALQDSPNKNIIATGCVDIESLNERLIKDGASEPELHDPKLILEAAKNLEQIAQKAKSEYGAQLHYHNHSWEFADDGLIFFTLADHCPTVNFALDTGWASVSGFDPVELLEKYPGRFHYVHLRDLKKGKDTRNLTFRQAHTGFADLGSADMNYPRLFSCLNRTLGPDDWAIVEYELGNFDHLSYLKAVSYLKGILDAFCWQKGE